MLMKNPEKSSSSSNLRRLALLRGLMLTAELVVVLGVYFLANIALPLIPLFTIFTLMAFASLWTWKHAGNGAIISDREFFLQLCTDVLALTAVLYFTGGATNPFAWLFLIPLIIAATVLSTPAVWFMAALTTLCYSLLFFFYQPLGNDAHMHHDQAFSQHIFGMWFGFALSAVLIAWFVVGISNTLRQRDELLARAREQALRDEQLVALGTLATGAAHELGTPLSTMAVVTRELERAEVPDSMKRKLTILRSQVDRCKQALSVISASAGELRAESGGLAPVLTWLEHIIDTWKAQRHDASITVNFPQQITDAAIIDEQTLQQSIINLLNNAADASGEELVMEVRRDSSKLTIDILDRGPGLHPKIAATLGEQQSSNKEHGMGLGLLLTHATLRRLGGDIALFDRQGGGTCTRIQLPLTRLDTPL
ncbi:two-component system sensor histidine kinase RegB [Thiogranum longum]|uniref:histidine kinase n=1 Tax=Thiogranum longum TaxID=1537524 RepID=A0A4R1HBF9_9GAMM|nr:ATP-binding protein [Thiogranum longum]TCK19297.1 two-component system sensor histidine kinase RegB [Thiogranum longum]